VPKGYLAQRFEGAFARYGLKGASEPLHRYKADEIRTSEAFQTATSEPDVAARKCEKPNSDAGCSGVAVEKGETLQNAHTPHRDGTAGLSDWRIRQLAAGYMEGAEAQFDSTGDTDRAALDRELRQTLSAEGVFPEFIEIELERVMKVVFAV